MKCKHGTILYGEKCLNCEREKSQQESSKPTIKELEEILEGNTRYKIEILPNGSIKANPVSQKDEYVFILERDNNENPVYLHSWDCSNYCDYACNGNEGFQMAEKIKENE